MEEARLVNLARHTLVVPGVVFLLSKNLSPDPLPQIVDVPMPQIPEQIVDVPVPQIMEETDEVAKLNPQERIQQRTLEETVNVPVLQIQQQIVAVGKAVPSRGENGRSPRRAQPHRRGAGGCAGRAAASVLRRRVSARFSCECLDMSSSVH